MITYINYEDGQIVLKFYLSLENSGTTAVVVFISVASTELRYLTFEDLISTRHCTSNYVHTKKFLFFDTIDQTDRIRFDINLNVPHLYKLGNVNMKN